MAKVIHVHVPVQQFHVNGSRMIERVGQLFLQLITVVWKPFQFTKIYIVLQPV